jgi:hypothetical protein
VCEITLENVIHSVRPRLNSLARRACAFMAVVSVASCGGGGSTPPTSQPTPAAPVITAPTTSTHLVTGAATKGPIRGATISFFVMDDFGVATGTALAIVTSDDSGGFSVDLAGVTIPVLVQSRGGSFIDESDQEPDPALRRQLILADTEGFESVIPAGASQVAITPFTQAIVNIARTTAVEGGNFFGILQAGITIYQNELGFDVLSTVPSNPNSPAPTDTTEAIEYALLLGGFANVSDTIAIRLGEPRPTYAIIEAIISDLQDGNVDGLNFDTPVSVLIKGAATLLPTDIDYNRQISRFRNNNVAKFSTVAAPVISPELSRNLAAAIVPTTPASPTNQAPIAVDDFVTATEDTPLTSVVDLDANDIDVNPLTVTAGTFTTSKAGNLILAGNGSYIYTPAANFNGTDSIIYTVTDGALTDAGKLNITVSAVNDAPIAVDDTVTVTADTVFSSTVDLDANDTDIDLDLLTVTAGTFTTAQEGELILVADGSYTYTPTAGFNGTYTVTYTLTDGALTDTGTLTITVNPATPATPANPADTAPVAVVTPTTLTVVSGLNATLDGSASSDPQGDTLSYNWAQTSGPLASLTNTTSATLTFTAPVAIVAPQLVQLTLTVTDSTGATGMVAVIVEVVPVIGLNVVAVEESVLPFQFGSDVGQSVGFAFDANGTGVATNEFGTFNYNWTEVTDTALETVGNVTLDFTVSGGLKTATYTTFEDNNADNIAEQILNTKWVSSAIIKPTANGDGATKDEVIIDYTLTTTRFDVTNSVELSGAATSLESTGFNLYNISAVIPYTEEELKGKTLLLPVSQPLLFASVAEPQLDSHSFAVDGAGARSGSTLNKNVALDWSIGSNGQLQVTYPSDFESAIFYRYAQKNSGDVVMVEQTYTDNSVRLKATLSFTDDPAQVHSLGDIAGTYTDQRFETFNSGTRISTAWNYFIFPNGSGVLETPTYDVATEAFTGWSSSNLGICAAVVNSQMVWKYTRQLDEYFTGSTMPTPTICSTLADSAVSYQQDHILFDVNALGEQRAGVKQLQNSCGNLPVTSPQPSGCDATLSVNGFFPRIHKRVKYLDLTGSPTQPIVTFPDTATAGTLGDGPTNILVLANDGVYVDEATGYSPVSPAVVEQILILTQPTFGTVEVNTVLGGATGSTQVATYTPVSADPATGTVTTDTFQYRLKDTANNRSTFTTVTVTFNE